MYAIFGGSFNPITKAHLEVIDNLLQAGFEKVLVVPCGMRSDKPALLPFKYRFEMVKLAVSENKRVEVLDIEDKLPQPTKTITTFRALKKYFPKEQLAWVIGADLVDEIPGWHEADALIREVEWVVIQRIGYEIPKITRLKVINVVEGSPKGISSTQVRERIKQHKTIRSLVNERVSSYISANALYI